MAQTTPRRTKIVATIGPASATPERVRARVEEMENGRARCGVLVGGPVTSHKGVNLPGVPIPIPSLTRKDLEDLEFALELGVDYVALSFVRSAADVRDLKALIDQAGSHAHVIARSRRPRRWTRSRTF